MLFYRKLSTYERTYVRTSREVTSKKLAEPGGADFGKHTQIEKVISTAALTSFIFKVKIESSRPTSRRLHVIISQTVSDRQT